jgi:hypothetical protein
MEEKRETEFEGARPVAPFNPTAPPSAGEGCGRIPLIGCGLLILLLGAAAVVFLIKAGDLFAWAMTRFEAEIVGVLPDDFTDEERQRLHEAFSHATDAVRTGEFDPLALQRLQSKLRESILNSGGRLSRQEVLELIDLLEGVGGAVQEPEPESEAGVSAQVAALAVS